MLTPKAGWTTRMPQSAFAAGEKLLAVPTSESPSGGNPNSPGSMSPFRSWYGRTCGSQVPEVSASAADETIWIVLGANTLSTSTVIVPWNVVLVDGEPATRSVVPAVPS